MAILGNGSTVADTNLLCKGSRNSEQKTQKKAKKKGDKSKSKSAKAKKKKKGKIDKKVGVHRCHPDEIITRHAIHRENAEPVSIMVAKRPLGVDCGSGVEYLHSASVVFQRCIEDVTPCWRKMNIKMHDGQSEIDDALAKSLREFIFGSESCRLLASKTDNKEILQFDLNSVFDSTSADKGQLIVDIILQQNSFIHPGAESPKLHIADLCCGAGGNTWKFLHSAKTKPGSIEKVVSVEADRGRVDKMRHNMNALMLSDGFKKCSEASHGHNREWTTPQGNKLDFSIHCNDVKSWADNVRATDERFDWLHMSPPWGGMHYRYLSSWWGSPESSIRNQNAVDRDNYTGDNEKLDNMNMRRVVQKLAGLSRNYLLFLPKNTDLVETVWTGASVLGSGLIEIVHFRRTDPEFITNLAISFMDCPTDRDGDTLFCKQDPTAGLLENWQFPKITNVDWLQTIRRSFIPGFRKDIPVQPIRSNFMVADVILWTMNLQMSRFTVVKIIYTFAKLILSFAMMVNRFICEYDLQICDDEVKPINYYNSFFEKLIKYVDYPDCHSEFIPKTYHALMECFEGYNRAQYKIKGLQFFSGHSYPDWDFRAHEEDYLRTSSTLDSLSADSSKTWIARALCECLDEPPEKLPHFVFYVEKIPLYKLMHLISIAYDICFLELDDKVLTNIMRVWNVGDPLTVQHDTLSWLKISLMSAKYSPPEKAHLGGIYHQLIKQLFNGVYKDWDIVEFLELN